MARFWKRSEDESIERLLHASRQAPRDEFASSLLDRITRTTFGQPRSTGSSRRVGLALALTVVSVALVSVLGGISAASAGMGGIFHVASNAVSQSHHESTPAGKGDKGDKGDKSKGENSDNNGDDEGDDDGNSGDHHQYKVGLCHWANHKYVLIFVSPQGAANHLAHHPLDKLPVNGKC